MMAIIPPTVLFLPILAYAQNIPQSYLISPPESTAIKSWGLLKGSVNDIGDEVMKMMEVRTDMTSMQDDLKMQEELWKQGLLQLNEEKATLQDQLEKLREQVRTGEVVRTNVMNFTHAVSHEKAYLVDQKALHSSEQAEWTKLRTVYQSKKHELMIQLQDEEQKIQDQEHRNEIEHDELMSDQASLRIKVSQLLSKIQDMKSQDKAAGSKDEMAIAELLGQQTQMKAGLQTVTGDTENRTGSQERLAALQAQLAEETKKLQVLQQAHNNEAITCNQRLRELQQVLQAETSKEQARHQEKLSLCQPVQAQKELLHEQLAACQQKAPAIPVALHSGPMAPCSGSSEWCDHSHSQVMDFAK